MESLGKRLLSAAAAVVVSWSLLLPGFAAPEKSVKTNKTEYIEGEDILVTATGEGKDWVGLYLTSDTVKTDVSIHWYYAKDSGEVNIRDANYHNNERVNLFDIPAGEYTVYLFANDGYEILDSTNITVIPDPNAEPPAAPASAAYERTAAMPGLAEGKLIIQANEGKRPECYLAYWANANGPLADYTAFPTLYCSGSKTTYQLEAGTMIPKDADRILVYACTNGLVSETAATVLLPEGSNVYDFGELRYEMQVVSDIHITKDQNHIHNRHFAMLLEQIQQLSPNSIGLFVNGDTADSGSVAEYKNMRQMVEDAGDGLPKLYFSMGNHDFMNGQPADKIANFLKYTETDSDTVYHDTWIQGTHFIFLASEKDGLHADLSQTQLDWFRETLAKDRDENRPIYVFLHQGLMNTVAGCFDYQDWHGVVQSDELSAILKEYPEVILFSGHSHWEMDSYRTMKERDDDLPTIFNTAAGGYLWNDDCMDTNVGIEGSQCYFFYAYDNAIVARGRDIANGKWIASSQYFVDYGAKEALLSAENTKNDATESTDTTAPAPTTEDGATDTASANPVLWIIIGVAAVAGITTVCILCARKKK